MIKKEQDKLESKRMTKDEKKLNYLDLQAYKQKD